MSAANECYAYFCVAGSFDPLAITELVGVAPSRTYMEGDPIPGTQKVRTCSRWMLYSRLERSATLESHISDVLDQLDANRDGFRQVSLKHQGTMELVGYFHAFYPGIVLERAIVERLAQYALCVDCDFYLPSDLRGDGEPGSV